MPTFTAVIHHDVAINLESYSIDRLVLHFREVLLESAARGSKVEVTYSLLTNMADEKFLLATLTVRNSRRRVIDKALVWGEQALTPGRRSHANDFRRHIRCSACQGDLFYDIGRSRDYNRHVCAKCGQQAATLTETGASA